MENSNFIEDFDPQYFTCECHSPEHTLIFTLDRESNEIYTSVFLLEPPSIWRRIWIGIKYIFGYKCKYGHWDCFSLKQKDVYRLINLLMNLSERSE